MVDNPCLRQYVQDRLAGEVRRPDGSIVTGPRPAPWKGRNKPRRQDRRWATAWSPVLGATRHDAPATRAKIACHEHRS